MQKYKREKKIEFSTEVKGRYCSTLMQKWIPFEFWLYQMHVWLKYEWDKNDVNKKVDEQRKIKRKTLLRDKEKPMLSKINDSKQETRIALRKINLKYKWMSEKRKAKIEKIINIAFATFNNCIDGTPRKEIYFNNVNKIL